MTDHAIANLSIKLISTTNARSLRVVEYRERTRQNERPAHPLEIVVLIRPAKHKPPFDLIIGDAVRPKQLLLSAMYDTEI